MVQQRVLQRGDQRAPQRGFMIRTGRNRFDIDLSKKPPGMSYEWKAVTVLGRENTEGMINCEVNGWTPVPADRHPEIMGAKAATGASIVRGGQMLHERPVEITEESRMMEKMEAGNQYSAQLSRLGLVGHRAAGKGIKKSYEQVVDEDE